MSIKKEEIEIQLQKILNSPKFRRSQNNCDLLRYLVAETVAGKHPNELKIGIEVFNINYEQNEKANANIRVYIFNLRRKLKEYYNTVGVKDDIIFEVEKGDYIVNFNRKEIDNVSPKSNHSKFKTLFLVSIGALVIALSTFVYLVRNAGKSEFKNAPIWGKFYDSELPILLVLGDYFLMESEIVTGEIGITRSRDINSIHDFNQYIKEHPELIDKMKPAAFSYLAKSAPVCMGMVQSVITDMGKEFQIKLSSEVQISDFKDYNIIFIGAYKSKQPIDNILYSMKMKYNIVESGRKYLIADDANATTYEIIEDDIKKEDFSTILNFESFSGNQYLFFLSGESAGNIALVRLFTDKQLLDSFFEEKIKPLKTDQFKALFQVSGIKTTDFSYELVRIDSLNHK